MGSSINYSSASFWEKTTFLADRDIVVIGAGLTGLWSAYHLKKAKPHLSIAVLERGPYSVGASTKNAGFACFGSAGELLDDLQRMSRESIQSLVADRYHGLQEAIALLGAESIDYQAKGGFELFRQEAEGRQIADQLDFLNEMVNEAIGRRPYSIRNEKIAQSGFQGISTCVENHAEGQLDTGKLYLRLVELLRSEGVELLFGLSILGIHPGERVSIETTFGNISSAQVLLATNGFAKQFYPKLAIEPARAQVLITKPLQNLKLSGSFHMHHGYYYFRDVGNRVLIGGARHLDIPGESTTESGITTQITDDLVHLLRTHLLPESNFEIDYAWSGVMGVGDVKQPILGMVEPNVFVAVRLGGMGVALSHQLGKRAAAMLLKA